MLQHAQHSGRDAAPMQLSPIITPINHHFFCDDLLVRQISDPFPAGWRGLSPSTLPSYPPKTPGEVPDYWNHLFALPHCQVVWALPGARPARLFGASPQITKIRGFGATPSPPGCCLLSHVGRHLHPTTSKVGLQWEPGGFPSGPGQVPGHDSFSGPESPSPPPHPAPPPTAAGGGARPGGGVQRGGAVRGAVPALRPRRPAAAPGAACAGRRGPRPLPGPTARPGLPPPLPAPRGLRLSAGVQVVPNAV